MSTSLEAVSNPASSAGLVPAVPRSGDLFATCPGPGHYFLPDLIQINAASVAT